MKDNFLHPPMKDNCVTCNKETLYRIDDPIDMRIGYIEGAGQLCLDCFGGSSLNNMIAPCWCRHSWGL